MERVLALYHHHPMEPLLKRKVTSKLSYNEASTSRPASPVKTLASQPSISAIRPKAKVNSSASARPAKAKSVVSARSPPMTTALSSIPRPASPRKFIRPAPSQPPAAPRIRAARSNLSPKVPHSAPTTPIIPSRDPLEVTVTGPRYGMNAGIPNSPQLSDRDGPFYSELSSNESSLLNDSQPDHPSPPPPMIKVKSKVSSVAKQASGISDTLRSPSPSYPSTMNGNHRVRAPSLTSSVSLGSSPGSNNFYPITTATSAANPHRFTTTRGSPPSRHHYQPFSSPITRDDHNVTYNANPFPNLKKRASISRVDPAFVPLPPNSPPTSAVSLSSRSSLSRSSAVDTQSVSSHQTHQGPGDLKSTLDALVQINGIEDDDESALGITHDDDPVDTEERKVKNEAKSNRKIQDLEITNRSLLAINSMLESTKNRQAKEIRDLRRKLRESRLILPPRTYRIIASKEDLDDDESDDSDEIPVEIPVEKTDNPDDNAFIRLRMMIDDMMETGKRALASKPEDFVTAGKGVAKVLTEDEVRSWRDSSGGGGLEETPRRTSPSRVAIPDDDDDFDSEDEVSAIILPHSNSQSPSPPPILITQSS